MARPTLLMGAISLALAIGMGFLAWFNAEDMFDETSDQLRAAAGSNEAVASSIFLVGSFIVFALYEPPETETY